MTPHSIGHIQGYASLFSMRDKDQDVVLRGAFRENLNNWKLCGRWPKMLWQHQLTNPIGVWTHMVEDAKGLLVQGQLNLETQQGAEAYVLLRQGAIEGLSIGYRTLKSRWNQRSQSRELLQLSLLEVSIVTLAANPLARVEVSRRWLGIRNQSIAQRHGPPQRSMALGKSIEEFKPLTQRGTHA